MLPGLQFIWVRFISVKSRRGFHTALWKARLPNSFETHAIYLLVIIEPNE